MLLTLFLFFLSALAIYLACEFFVNGIEWCGRHMKLGATAVGTVLAAFGTALPESAVTFTAVAFGSTPQQRDIGVGAAMGGPLVLATLAYAVVGLALWRNRQRLQRSNHRVIVDHQRLSHDQLAFLAIFVLKVALGLVAFAIKPWLGVLFLVAYAVYVWREIVTADTAPEEEELEALKFRPHNATLGWAALQVLAALAVIAVASHTFVGQLESIGVAFGLSPHLVALLLSPVATELPEIMNALIWVRQGKERLALANISGAMMIQATIPSALGIFFTPWLFDGPLLASGLITAAAIILLWRMFRRGSVDSRVLAPVGLLYGVFALYLAITFHA
ncbi:sodium:calcium antiporter [Neisseriaceae bacterium JH1-16]|nr:sodium:calcium antiporter [Neisseriaceae bacterium JH1-16]